ncbi:hypothetical protein [Crocosphaera sp. XPORK-15E]|uniref:hypothetical protein n=1 Tax=Crocosphaera sp. XPORK-15E TaxID=3110247 RepID=UPI002B1EC46E|nr:hypothetical protein [Crocosphaera sp. XPORK-15E]MEA5534606.1 hypothetical protein [Crocosphaera sp. XPORK-15E]
MSFQEHISSLNEFYFFREFTFSTNKFYKSPDKEVELADNIVWLDDIFIIYQLKEREFTQDLTANSEEKWFKKKVIGKAKEQIRDTVVYLQDFSNIQIQNHRLDTFNIKVPSPDFVHKLILYKPHEFLPESCRKHKYYPSKTAGFIHIISSEDYRGIVKTLITPAEFADYLMFREQLINKWEDEDTFNLPEQALVGQYLSGESENKPNLSFISYLQQLEHNFEEWDMSGIISIFLERITTKNPPTDYYYIIREIGKLMRHELREFKTRYKLSMEDAKANKIILPYRIAIPRTGCGFVFVPVTHDLKETRLNALQNFTHAHKYDQKLSKCIGVSFVAEEDGWYLIDWCYLDFPWQHDPELENNLQHNYPFRKVQSAKLSQYKF